MASKTTTPVEEKKPRLTKLERLELEIAAAKAKAVEKQEKNIAAEREKAIAFLDSIGKRVAPVLVKDVWTQVLHLLDDARADIVHPNNDEPLPAE